MKNIQDLLAELQDSVHSYLSLYYILITEFVGLSGELFKDFHCLYQQAAA